MTLVATRGTAAFLEAAGIACEVVNKVYEGRPNIVDLLKDGGIALVMNTTEGAQAVEDSREIRHGQVGSPSGSLCQVPNTSGLPANHCGHPFSRAATVDRATRCLPGPRRHARRCPLSRIAGCPITGITANTRRNLP